MALVHGDMWWNPQTGLDNCFSPCGTRKNISSAGALWMSGYDASDNLHIAAQTYRQHGNDYWPGPLDPTDTLTYATSGNWAKIWKVDRADINAFLAAIASGASLSSFTSILSWPGNGNNYATGAGGVALTITTDMAPFVDLNGDGIYEPQQGEYPDIKGDQALWWVFSDNGPAHNETNGRPLGLEVHAMAYAFSRGNFLDSAIFYNYSIINKSANTYHNFRASQFADMDMGNPMDDFIGCDTNRGLGIIYNGEPNDAIYGTNIPMAGILFMGLLTDSLNSRMGNFIYFNNDFSTSGNPAVDTEYNNYLRNKFRRGMHITDDYTSHGVPTIGFGSGPAANFVFPGDPSDNTQWSECSSGNTPGDRRFVIGSGDIQLNPGAIAEFDFALISTTPDTNNACGDSGLSYTNIKKLADQIRAVYDDDGGGHIPWLQAGQQVAKSLISIYPNPAHDELFLENTGNLTGAETITLFNMLGQVVDAPVSAAGKKTTINTAGLPPGLYNLLYVNGGTQTRMKFVKE
jgi:hypothetical protein